MEYVKGNGKVFTSIWRRMLSEVSTAPAKPYPLTEERLCMGLDPPPLTPSSSGFQRISSIRVWWTSKTTTSHPPKT